MWSALRLTVVAAGRRPFSEISPDVVGRIWSARVVCDMACEPLQLVGGTGRSTGVLLMLTFRIRLPEGNYLVKLFCRTATPARSAIVHMVQKAPPGGRPPAPLQGAFPADPYHEHVSPNRVEPVPLLQVALELGHQAVLDVQDTLADLTDGVLVVLDRDLVVNGTIAETHRMQGAGHRERLQCAVDRASREARLCVLQCGRDLIRRTVAAKGSDGVPNLLPLPRLPHARPQRWSGADSLCHWSEGYRASGRAARMPLSGGQPAMGVGEHPAAAGLDQHVVFDPDAAPSRNVNTGLDRDHHPLLEDGGAARVETGILMSLQPQTMPDSVDEAVGKPALADHRPCGLVDLPHPRARPHRRDRRFLGGLDERVHLALACVGLAQHDRSGDVSLVAFPTHTEVHQHHVAGGDPAIG